MAVSALAFVLGLLVSLPHAFLRVDEPRGASALPVTYNYDARAALTTTPPSARGVALRQYDGSAQHLQLGTATISGRLAAEGAGNALRFTGDQDALIQLAKNAKRRGGLTEEEGKILKQWGDEYDVPVRGPESHPGRGFGSNPHYHVGPVRHIPLR